MTGAGRLRLQRQGPAPAAPGHGRLLGAVSVCPGGRGATHQLARGL